MRGFEPVLPLGVAFSGGADSTALLVLCARQWPGQVHALHVNHGIQQAAASFEDHCQEFCQKLHTPLRVARVDAGKSLGQSPEDAARVARYRALCSLAQGDDGRDALGQIALAQHADDQVETLLLALSRGAGLSGLSAMPASFLRHGVRFIRPLLAVSGRSIREWLNSQQIPFIEDPTNADIAFTRNRIRAEILPPLEAAFPHFRETFSRSANHAAQAQSILDEIAAQDFNEVVDGASDSTSGPLRGDSAVNIQRLRKLSRARQGNVIRHWLKVSFETTPTTAQLDELLRQIACCSTRGHQICLKVGAGQVERKGNTLTWYNRPVLL